MDAQQLKDYEAKNGKVTTTPILTRQVGEEKPYTLLSRDIQRSKDATAKRRRGTKPLPIG